MKEFKKSHSFHKRDMTRKSCKIVYWRYDRDMRKLKNVKQGIISTKKDKILQSAVEALNFYGIEKILNLSLGKVLYRVKES